MSKNDQATPERSPEEIAALMKGQIAGAVGALESLGANVDKLTTDEKWRKAPVLLATHLHTVFAGVSSSTSKISDLITELMGADAAAAAADGAEGEDPAASD